MRRRLGLLFVVTCFLIMSFSPCFAQKGKVSVLLLIAEQNIEGPQRCWWASEVDLSAVEARLSSTLIAQGYVVLDPSKVKGILKKEKAFRRVDISDDESIGLAKLSKADYVILGKAVASSGANVLSSNMRSCFANATVKLIRVKDASVVAYLDATGSSAHMDVISGGREALLQAADDLVAKIINTLSPQGSSDDESK